MSKTWPAWAGRVGALWGVAGFLALLASAVRRLTPFAVDALRHPLQPVHWVALVAMTAFMIYSEGHRGVHCNLAPRFAARMRHLQANPRPLHVLLAPFFCVGYFHARRRRVVSVWALTAMIVALIVLVHHVHQPWRGLIDFAVVVGLLWGMTTIVLAVARACRGEAFAGRAELPEA